jgi:predicted DNA-binding protein YlxM (UPF0122 family)
MKEVHDVILPQCCKSQDQQQHIADLLQSRIDLLTGRDKVLMKMYLEKGANFSQLAKLAGASEAKIARRIRTLSARLVDGRYIAFLRNKDKFTETELDIAKNYFLLGLSMRKIAENMKYTYYRIRKTIKRINNILIIEKMERRRKNAQ